jgi:hypothetical protein
MATKSPFAALAINSTKPELTLKEIVEQAGWEDGQYEAAVQEAALAITDMGENAQRTILRVASDAYELLACTEVYQCQYTPGVEQPVVSALKVSREDILAYIGGLVNLGQERVSKGGESFWASPFSVNSMCFALSMAAKNSNDSSEGWPASYFPDEAKAWEAHESRKAWKDAALELRRNRGKEIVAKRNAASNAAFLKALGL